MKTQKILAVFFSFLILLSSCSSPGGASYSVIDDTSSEDIFRSIYFLDGPLVSKISIIKNKKDLLDQLELSPEELQKVRDHQDLIIATFNEIAPQFMDEFKRTIQGKSPYQVQEKMREGADFLVQAVRQLGYMDLIENDAYVKVLNEHGIDLNAYDYRSAEDIERLYSDINNLDPSVSAKIFDQESSYGLPFAKGEDGKCIAFAIALAVVFLAAAILAVEKVAGVAEVVYFIAYEIEVIEIEDSPEGISSKSAGGSLGEGILISELIGLN